MTADRKLNIQLYRQFHAEYSFFFSSDPFLPSALRSPVPGSPADPDFLSRKSPIFPKIKLTKHHSGLYIIESTVMTFIL